MSLEFSTDNERYALFGFLDQQRDALIRKVSGVSEEQSRSTPTASDLSLLSLIKHCTIWEERWFQGIFNGQTLADGWPERRSTRGSDFAIRPEDTPAEWIARYRSACETSRHIAAAVELSHVCAREDLVPENLRYVLLHLIEETARHAGHADIIRESIDGSRGM